MADSVEKRLKRLEDREARILRLLDSRKDPWDYFVLESDLDRDQALGISDVMEASYQALVAGSPPSALDFEKKLVAFMPLKVKAMGGYDFVKGVLMVFAATGQWFELVDHFRRDFNVTFPRQPELGR